MLQRFRGWLGFHQWAYFQRERSITHWRQCSRCDREEWGSYDMTFGYRTWWKSDGSVG